MTDEEREELVRLVRQDEGCSPEARQILDELVRHAMCDGNAWASLLVGVSRNDPATLDGARPWWVAPVTDALMRAVEQDWRARWRTRT